MSTFSNMPVLTITGGGGLSGGCGGIGGSSGVVGTSSNTIGPVYSYSSGSSEIVIRIGDIGPWSKMIGDTFDSNRIFATDFCITEPGSFLHFKTFLCLHPDVCDYSYVILPPTHEALLCFSSHESLNTFTEWLERYRRRFFSRVKTTEGLVPRLDDKQSATVTLVPSPASLWNEAELVETWAWIVRNCAAPVYKIERMLAFESEIDATLFKMHFT